MQATLSSTGIIKSMQLPEVLSNHKEKSGGYGGDNWLHTYANPGQRYPQICYRYSGSPQDNASAQLFRKLLKSTGLLFEDGKSNPAEEDLVRELELVLGNSGDNQLCNTESGPRGPRFHLLSLAVQEINARSVLRLNGYFQDHSREPVVYLDCIFIDASAAESECRIEELFLESFPKRSFDDMHDDFEKVIASIVWAN